VAAGADGVPVAIVRMPIRAEAFTRYIAEWAAQNYELH